MSADIGPSSKRGQPLVALAGILLCWIAVRAALFELPPRLHPLDGGVASTLASIDPSRQDDGGGLAAGSPTIRPITGDGSSIGHATGSRESAFELSARPLPILEPLPSRPVAPVASRYAAAHNLLWMAAMRALSLLPEVAIALGPEGSKQPSSLAANPTVPARRSSWSGDGWLAWRAGTSRLVEQGAVTPVYGASQAGAILRYDLAPNSTYRPVGYIRAVRALEGTKEGDLAAGFSLQPVPSFPITAHAEARLARRGSDLALRPAAFVSGGFEDQPIHGGIAARGYAQAGYVGGPDATVFADGSLIAEKPVSRENSTLLAAGAGAWGGAQRGTARLDLGPSASLKFRLGEGTARVSADYRLRVAGNAEPASGAALTVSAGF